MSMTPDRERFHGPLLPKDMKVTGFDETGRSVYSIELSMVESHRMAATISTCRQHAVFSGAVRTVIDIAE